MPPMMPVLIGTARHFKLSKLKPHQSPSLVNKFLLLLQRKKQNTEEGGKQQVTRERCGSISKIELTNAEALNE